MDQYTAWTQAELQWAEPLRRRKRRILRKVFFIILLPFLLGALAVPFVLGKYSSDPAEALAYSLLLLCFGLLLDLFIVCALLPGSGKKSYAKHLRKAVLRLAPTSAQQAQLGQDLLKAYEDPRRRFEFSNPAQSDAPMHFVLGQRYAFLSGGWEYKPYILPLTGIRGFSTDQDGAVLNGEAIRLYFIWFEGLRKKDGFAFHDAQSRDRALAMLQAQLAGKL